MKTSPTIDRMRLAEVSARAHEDDERFGSFKDGRPVAPPAKKTHRTRRPLRIGDLEFPTVRSACAYFNTNTQVLYKAAQRGKLPLRVYVPVKWVE